MLSSPPPAEARKVDNFLPGVDLGGNPRYQVLSQGMTEEQVEFAKALCICEGNASRAGAMLFPKLSEPNQRQRGSRLKKEPQVQALWQWFSGLGIDDERPVTHDEFARGVRAKWRKAVASGGDVSTFVNLTELVREIDGMDEGKRERKPYDDVEDALAMADLVLAGL